MDWIWYELASLFARCHACNKRVWPWQGWTLCSYGTLTRWYHYDCWAFKPVEDGE